MPIVCSVCQKADHLADDCPTLVVPPAETLPQPPPQQLQLLDRICSDVFSQYSQRPDWPVATSATGWL